jgi:hypothetical protein
MMMNVCVENGVGAGNVGVVVDETLVGLHRTLKRIAKARAHLDLQEAEALRQAQQLRLWRNFGHVSLADYMVRELGYASHRVAEERLRLANALPALPEISRAIENGEINFSKARELVRVATPANEQAWLDKAKEMNVREVEQAVAGHARGDLPEDPVDPALVRKTMWLSVRPETEVLFREVKRALNKERGEKLDEDAVVEALCRAYLTSARAPAKRTAVAADPASAAPSGDLESVPRGSDPDSVPRGSDQRSAARERRVSFIGDPGDPSTQLNIFGEEACGSGLVASSEMCESSATTEVVVCGAAPYRIAITLCSNCRRGWQHGGGAVEEMTLAAVARAQCDAQWIGDIDQNVVERARQEISPATRRKVMHRDQGRCQVPGCKCFTNLDIHHIKHRSLGGSNHMSNLITLCEGHHLAHHEGILVIERGDGSRCFRWLGKNRFTRIANEVATRKALCERNLGRDLVAEIMGRTISHVGVNDVSVDEWLVIAERYAAQLTR